MEIIRAIGIALPIGLTMGLILGWQSFSEGHSSSHLRGDR
jgi:hypothetical protein